MILIFHTWESFDLVRHLAAAVSAVDVLPPILSGAFPAPFSAGWLPPQPFWHPSRHSPSVRWRQYRHSATSHQGLVVVLEVVVLEVVVLEVVALVVEVLGPLAVSEVSESVPNLASSWQVWAVPPQK